MNFVAAVNLATTQLPIVLRVKAEPRHRLDERLEELLTSAYGQPMVKFDMRTCTATVQEGACWAILWKDYETIELRAKDSDILTYAALIL